MGSELLELPKTTNFTQLFWEAYPAYITMGMPPEEYWHGDAESCVAYRKAREESMRIADIMAWRQGAYIYQALCCVAPYFNSIKPQKPQEYIKPFGFESSKKTDSTPKGEMEEAIAYMKAWADAFNAKRKENNGEQRNEN